MYPKDETKCLTTTMDPPIPSSSASAPPPAPSMSPPTRDFGTTGAGGVGHPPYPTTSYRDRGTYEMYYGVGSGDVAGPNHSAPDSYGNPGVPPGGTKSRDSREPSVTANDDFDFHQSNIPLLKAQLKVHEQRPNKIVTQQLKR